MTLNRYQKAARARVTKQERIRILANRMDKHVMEGENQKPGSKGRARSLKAAEYARVQLRLLEH